MSPFFLVPIPIGMDMAARQEFLILKYVEKKWYSESNLEDELSLLPDCYFLKTGDETSGQGSAAIPMTGIKVKESDDPLDPLYDFSALANELTDTDDSLAMTADDSQVHGINLINSSASNNDIFMYTVEYFKPR